MRAISAGLQTFLDANNKCLVRHLLTITLSSGTVVRWTDHSANVTISGNTWLAGGSGTVPLVKVGKRRDPAGTEIGELEITLYAGEGAQLAGMRLPLAAISDGFDGATVRVDRVYGPADLDLALGTLRLFDGRIAEIEPSSSQVVISCLDAREDLKIKLPRIGITPACTATHYDGQCALVKASWTGTGAAASGSTATKIRSGRTEADGFFDLGVITFTSGVNAGYKRAVRAYRQTNGEFELDEALPGGAPAVGDTFSAFPGCDKRWETCVYKYNNASHFRGFPLMPANGNDARKRGMTGPTPPYTGRWYGYVPPLPLPRSGYLPDPINAPPDDPLPIVYGQNLVDGTLIYRAGPTDSTNVCDLLVAFCEGPITNGGRAWINNTFYSSIHDLETGGGSTLFYGSRPTQTHWSRFTLTEPNYLCGYPGVAYLASATLKLPIGDTGNYRLEVNGFLSVTPDADPAAIIADSTYGLLPNAAFGAGFAWPVNVDTGPDGTAASSARRYFDAARIVLSPVIASRRAASEALRDILDACNASCRMSDGTLEIIPLGDVEFTGTSLVTNTSVTYTPYTTPQYAFTESTFITGGEEDPISVRRVPRADVFNICPVEFTERNPTGEQWNSENCYQTRTVEDPEPVDVAAFGPRRSGALSMPMIMLPSVALTISRLAAQRSVKRRNSYTFKVGYRYAPLEPLDYVLISDAHFGITERVVRVTAIEEDESGVMTIEAEDAPYGISHAVAHTVQSNESDFPGSLWTQPAASDLWNVPNEAVKERHIAPGAVTGTKIADDAITAGKIHDAAITAGKIMDGVVSAVKLLNLAPGAALNADPACADTSAWAELVGYSVHAPVFATVADGQVGTTVLRSYAGAVSWMNEVRHIPVDPEKTYRFHAWARTVSGTTGTLYLGVAAFDSNNGSLGGDGTQWHYVASAVVPAGTWTEYSGQFGAGTAHTLPAAARTIAPLVILSYGTTPDRIFEVQDVRIEEAIPSTLIQDGAITTGKLTAYAVTAGKIAAGAVGADKIAANSITARELVLTDWSNLNPNPSGDQYDGSGAAAGYAGGYNLITSVDAVTHCDGTLPAGSRCVQLSCRDGYAGPWFACKPGDEFWASAEAWTLGCPYASSVGIVTSTTPDFSGAIDWRGISSFTANTSGKQTRSGAVTVPSNANYVRIWMVIDGPGSQELAPVYFRNFLVRRKANADLIVDGAITAAKISANALQTTDYTFTGTEGGTDEVATQGAKLQRGSGGGKSLLVAAGNLKVGTRLLDQCDLILAAGLIYLNGDGTVTPMWCRGLRAATPIDIAAEGGLAVVRIFLSAVVGYHEATLNVAQVYSASQTGLAHPVVYPVVANDHAEFAIYNFAGTALDPATHVSTWTFAIHARAGVL